MPKLIPVYTENNDYQKFEVLKRNRNKRHKYQEFFVEGVRNINGALRRNWTIQAFLYAKDKKLSQWGADILASSRAKFHYELYSGLMDKLSDKEETSELIAIVSMPPDDPSRIKAEGPLLAVVFDRPSNRGNLGTILRSCDALGAHGLIMTGHAVDLYDPETIRATMGSFFHVPSIRMDAPQQVEDWVSRMRGEHPGLQVVGTSAHGSINVQEADLTKPTVLLIGNETEGLSFKYKEMCDTLVKIPMVGSASSLNVASAASILLYEAARQRG